MDRRSFLMSSAAALGAASSTFGAANDKVRVACIGIGGRGKDHIGGYSKLDNVEVAAICDIDDSHIANGLTQLDEARQTRSRRRTKTYASCSRDKDIDAISIATPNHWHTLMAIWGMQAGKDVYVEKPCSHNMFEAKQIVAAARKYNRIVPAGQPDPLLEGRAGSRAEDARRPDRRRLSLARPLLQVARHHRPQAGRAGARRRRLRPVDRPAPMHQFTRNRFHYNWHWFWDYRQRRPRQPGHPRGGHRPLGPRREVPGQGQRHRRPLHVRRRPGDAQHPQLRLRVQRERQAQDDGVRGAPLDDATAKPRIRERGNQRHRQPVLRLQGLPGGR